MARRDAPERHHLEHFCPPALRYGSTSELYEMLLAFDPKHWDPVSIQRRCDIFRPEKIAPEFERTFALSQADASELHFSHIDKTLILKRRLQRSLRARMSQRHKQSWDLLKTTIDPSRGFPVEE